MYIYIYIYIYMCVYIYIYISIYIYIYICTLCSPHANLSVNQTSSSIYPTQTFEQLGLVKRREYGLQGRGLRYHSTESI